MTIYVVIYKDGSWGNTGDNVLGVFDNKKQAKDLVDYVMSEKDEFKNLSGSMVYIDEFKLNKIDDIDETLSYLH